MRHVRIGALMAATILVGLVAAACGNVTVGGFSEANVVVSGDVDTLSASALSSVLPSGQSATSARTLAFADDGPAASPEEAEGEVHVEFLAFLVTETGGTLQLGEEEIQISVDIKGRTEMDAIERQLIPAARYTEFRLIFTEIEAQVEGLVIDGVPVPQVRVEIEDLSLLVSRPLDLATRPGEVAELVVDLNSLAWLAAVDPLTGSVDQSVFADLVDVVIR